MSAADSPQRSQPVGPVSDRPQLGIETDQGGRSKTGPTHNLLFVFTGSIAGYKACDAVSRLVQRGHRVRVVATESALKFVGAATFEGLTGSPVATDIFEPGAALDHINLTRWADAVVVCPATANTINRFAAGLADDLPGALFLAHDRNKPWLIAPAMNPAMWAHPATQASVEKLSSWGVRFVAPGAGRTACGELGEGRLAESAQIVEAVERALAKPAKKLRVLVTSGGTSEPIDGVRVITNTSTGGTGAGIADHFARSGHDVVLLRARHAVRPDAACIEEVFATFAELDAALTRRLGSEKFDAIIHAAAVGDFRVESVEVNGVVQPQVNTKLESKTPPLLRLQAQPKLVDTLRARSPFALSVVAFKLTQGAVADEAHGEVKELLAHSGADFVVHNDLAARGAQPGDFPATIYAHDASVAAQCPTRAELSAALERLLVNAATENVGGVPSPREALTTRPETSGVGAPRPQKP